VNFFALKLHAPDPDTLVPTVAPEGYGSLGRGGNPGILTET